ncbi:hypothetical protein ACFWFF_07625 [Streptomyces sp. NPDC060223]
MGLLGEKYGFSPEETILAASETKALAELADETADGVEDVENA